MPLTDKDIESLTEYAEERGLEPDDVIAAAEEELEQRARSSSQSDDDEPETEDKEQKGGPLKFDRALLGHLPYMTVNEIRASFGLGPVADGGLYDAEWRSKHTPAGAAGQGGGTPAAED